MLPIVQPQIRPVGPTTARIMIVGEAPGEQEISRGEPFVGQAGDELNRMLHDAGISRSECFITSVARVRPPYNVQTKTADAEGWFARSKTQRTALHTEFKGKFVTQELIQGIEQLRKEIELVKPTIIVALGNVAMWALTGEWGIKSWRASLLPCRLGAHACKVIPTYSPANILRQYSVRVWAVNDLKRVKLEQVAADIIRPHYQFIIRPSFDTAFSVLAEIKSNLDESEVPLHLSCDIETRAGQIACIGISWSKLEAICIPLMSVETSNYWMEEEEVQLMEIMQQVLVHPMAWISGQNFTYDAQYFNRHLGYTPRLMWDTMVGHHAMMPGTEKSLAFLSSIYCKQHLYWKDDGKEWNVKGMSEDSLWSYNCVDCVRTYEVVEEEQALQPRMCPTDVMNFQQMMAYPVLSVMNRGVRADKAEKAKLARDLEAAISSRLDFVTTVAGHTLNPKSPKKMQQFFYDDLAQPVVKNFKTKKPTCDDDAMKKIMKKEPILEPICNAILDLRSLGVFLSTFVNSRLDIDGRFRCSYNLAGPETFRLSSSENAFGSGLNLQNVPKGGIGDNGLFTPNVRTLFVPDEGMVFFDGDLDRADLQVVAWEAEEESLKEALKEGFDLHLWNANDLFDLGLNNDLLIEGHPEYEKIKKEFGRQRHLAKSWVHGTNYGGGAVTMARNCNITVAQAEKYRQIYFYKRPGIARWHRRVEESLLKHRYVENAFGYRRYYFDRPDALLPEALAWIPQSTVALYINMIWVAIEAEIPEAEIELQVHDSLAGQLPADRVEETRKKMQDIARTIVIPYADPLIIPFSVKTSPISWGHC